MVPSPSMLQPTVASSAFSSVFDPCQIVTFSGTDHDARLLGSDTGLAGIGRSGLARSASTSLSPSLSNSLYTSLPQAELADGEYADDAQADGEYAGDRRGHLACCSACGGDASCSRIGGERSGAAVAPTGFNDA